MIQNAIRSMENYTVQFPKTLLAIKLSDLEYKPSADRWSKKKILGHLIDSAINNLPRFIVAQYQDNPFVQYDQVAGCKANYYQNSTINDILMESAQPATDPRMEKSVVRCIKPHRKWTNIDIFSN